MTRPTLSIQLYSLRSLDGLEAQLDAASRAGYQAVELVEEQIADPRDIRANLDVRGLSAPSVHVSLTTLRDRPGEIVAGARMAGAKFLVVSAPPFGEGGSAQLGWRALGRELGGLAARLIDAGLTLCYHNHDWELTPLDDGSLPLDLLLQEGAEGGLAWQADIGWLARSGCEPADWLRRYRDRICSVHVKDLAPEGKAKAEDGWTDIGQGTLDWPDLWPRCIESGASLMVAEHDKPSDPSGFARRSYVTMEKLLANGAG